MKKGEKILILVLLVILIIAIIAFVGNKKQNKENNNNNENTITENNVKEEFVEVLENGTKLNTSSELKKVKQVGAYKFENMQLTEQKGQTILLADVTNTSSSATKLQLLNVTLLDKDGKEIVKVGGIIQPLQPGQTEQFNTSMTLDYSNTYDFKIELKK